LQRLKNEKAINMKKTLQINLAGMAFTIEEDAYLKLKQYLESVKKYFSSFEGSDEIISDIESRIAEKFFKNNESPVIVTIEDVNQIIASMGSVQDFEAITEEEDYAKTPPKNEETNFKASSKFYKDGKRRALGGVLSGLAHKFEIDVVWLRVLFIVLAFGLIETGIGGFLFIAYIVCWIAFPTNNELEENQKVKKFYRNPENKVIGGVATGLSSYLGIDLVIIRILFVITLFFGIGILVYLIFWIVAPNATTLTQKMELKGKPVTIENIENTLNEAKITDKSKEESAITKLLLFPFRLIGIILKSLGQLISPLGSFVKILIGLFLIVLGGILSFATIIATGAFFGVISNSKFFQGEQFLGLFAKDIPPYGGFFAFLLIFIPSIAIAIVGITLIANKTQGNRNFWITLVTLWFVGLLGTSTIGSRYALNFTKKYKNTVETPFTLPNNILYLEAKYDEEEDFNDDEMFHQRVEIIGSDTENLSIEQVFSASGKSKIEAKVNTENISYEISQKDSILFFPEKLSLKGEKVIRNQRVETVVKIPVNKKFKMSEQFARKIWSQSWRIKDKLGIKYENIQKFTFIIDENKEVNCVDCPKLSEEELNSRRSESFGENDFFEEDDFAETGDLERTFSLESFKNIDLGRSFVVTIKKSENYGMKAYSYNQKNLDELVTKINSETLKVYFEDSFKNRNGKINLIIETPTLEGFDISGSAIVKVIGFENLPKLNISLSGSSKLGIETNTSAINAELSGASNLLIRGSTQTLDLDLSGASFFYGKNLKASKANIAGSGASQIEISKIPNIKKSLSGSSEITID
jgi:phage shock protein PspC (stress-responsive transcriptional regulator)